MSYFIDVKYLEQIGYRLPLFTKKKGDLWNCRCIICGDSQTNKRKARGYFYRQKNELFYKCHNCDASQFFGTFLKQFDSFLYQQYVFEKFSQSDERPPPTLDNPLEVPHSAPRAVLETEKAFNRVFTPVSELLVSHEAIRYLNDRQIPQDRWRDLYYITQSKQVAEVAPQYSDSPLGDDPRIAFPFLYKGELVGVSMRAIRHTTLRYIIAKFDPEAPSVFGFDRLDLTRPIYVTEGAFDSLFLPNSMACNGTSFGKIDQLGLPKEQVRIIFDNQPRNPDVCRIMKKYIDLGFTVCIWPSRITQKDVNEMVLAGLDPLPIIDAALYSGLSAQLQFTQWKKC